MSPILHRTVAASVAALGLLAVVGAGSAQAQQSPAAAQAVGRWLYDAQGNTVGSVRALTDDGRSAVIMLGSYFRPGSHAVTVPIRQFAVVDGKVTLRSETALAMNTLSR